LEEQLGNGDNIETDVKKICPQDGRRMNIGQDTPLEGYGINRVNTVQLVRLLMKYVQ
jgi:hypothetical protein